ncbi:hypothetical protein F2Q70_00044712 [Brassica cretica]|uniref:Uncharacterized protein n=1 Tax=Brassica cretica TaxID=69181 RepID=A0A8S9KNA2_BRACR|nr:hypothetical protein F2Q70_00044712 [Brassica cretica]
MKGRRWQHRRRRQHRYNQRHVLPSPPRVILCSLAGVFSGVSSTVLHRLHHRYQFSTTVLRRLVYFCHRSRAFPPLFSVLIYIPMFFFRFPQVVQECKEIYENTLVDGNPPKTGFVFPRVKCLAASKGSLWRKRI